jgi:DNA-binding CsgD family transcriptional regulator
MVDRIVGAPVLRNAFFELVDDLEKVESQDQTDSFLRKLVADYELENVAYLGVNLPVQTEFGDLYVATTYSPDWLSRYHTNRYVGTDPVVQHSFLRVAPIDWADIDQTTPAASRIFGEAREFGIGNQGLTIPIHGVLGEKALFSISKTCSKSEWRAFRREFARDFQLLSFQFHESVLRREHLDVSEIVLSDRQTEVLRWASVGKSDWETARICNIREPTVRYHMNGAIAAMRAANKTQAVARAIRMRLI